MMANRRRVLRNDGYRGRFLRNDGHRGRFLRNDGSTPGPLPLICPSQRILNSCSALIKYRRVQTSLRRIIIRSEGCWLSSLNTLSLLSVLLLYMLLLKGVDNITTLQLHDWIERKKTCVYPPVPRYRSEWQDHVGTSALRCRPLASYVPLCSDLSGSASCTAPCIAGRRLHTRSQHAVRDGRIVTTWHKKGTRAFTYHACLRLDLILPPSVPGRIRPPHLKSPQRSLH